MKSHINSYRLARTVREENILKAIRRSWSRYHRHMRGGYAALADRDLSEIRRLEDVLEVGYW